MRLPRILLVVPLLVAGMYLPAAGPAIAKPAAGAIGMVHQGFAETAVSVQCGQTLTLQNDSRWVHIIGPGKGGLLVPNKDVPISNRQLMATNDVYTTGAWDVAGTFYLTCSVHPDMTVKVVVGGCCCTQT
jgi:plastocyanin